MPGIITGSVGHVGYRIFGQTKNPGKSTVACLLSFNDLVTALAHLLPRRQLTAEDLAAIIEQRQRLRRKAKGSHARCTQVALE
ncbi:MAG: hypothetical protein ACRD82_17685 [Blastocatellia bacterium]